MDVPKEWKMLLEGLCGVILTEEEAYRLTILSLDEHFKRPGILLELRRRYWQRYHSLLDIYDTHLIFAKWLFDHGKIGK